MEVEMVHVLKFSQAWLKAFLDKNWKKWSSMPDPTSGNYCTVEDDCKTD